MTVSELIDILSYLPRDMRILVAGYESGYDEPKVIPARKVWQAYKHQTVNGIYDDYPNEEAPFAAVIIDRTQEMFPDD